MTLTIADIVDAVKKAEVLGPGEKIAALLYTRTWLMLPGHIWKVEYEGKTYFLMHGSDLDKLLTQLPMVEAPVAFSQIAGIPVIEDTEKIREILYSIVLRLLSQESTKEEK